MDDDFFEFVNKNFQSQLQFFKVKNKITNHLPRPMKSDIATPVGAEKICAAGLQLNLVEQ